MNGQMAPAHVHLTNPFRSFLSMLEAMAAGCIVIGSDTVPVREVGTSNNIRQRLRRKTIKHIIKKQVSITYMKSVFYG